MERLAYDKWYERTLSRTSASQGTLNLGTDPITSDLVDEDAELEIRVRGATTRVTKGIMKRYGLVTGCAIVIQELSLKAGSRYEFRFTAKNRVHVRECAPIDGAPKRPFALNQPPLTATSAQFSQCDSVQGQGVGDTPESEQDRQQLDSSVRLESSGASTTEAVSLSNVQGAISSLPRNLRRTAQVVLACASLAAYAIGLHKHALGLLAGTIAIFILWHLVEHFYGSSTAGSSRWKRAVTDTVSTLVIVLTVTTVFFGWPDFSAQVLFGESLLQGASQANRKDAKESEKPGQKIGAVEIAQAALPTKSAAQMLTPTPTTTPTHLDALEAAPTPSSHPMGGTLKDVAEGDLKRVVELDEHVAERFRRIDDYLVSAAGDPKNAWLHLYEATDLLRGSKRPGNGAPPEFGRPLKEILEEIRDLIRKQTGKTDADVIHAINSYDSLLIGLEVYAKKDASLRPVDWAPYVQQLTERPEYLAFSLQRWGREAVQPWPSSVPPPVTPRPRDPNSPVILRIAVQVASVNSPGFIEFKAESEQKGELATGRIVTPGEQVFTWDMGFSSQRIWFWFDTLDGVADVNIEVDGVVVFNGRCTHSGSGEVRVADTCKEPRVYRTSGTPVLIEDRGKPITYVRY